jgi:hypothetical protein
MRARLFVEDGEIVGFVINESKGKLVTLLPAVSMDTLYSYRLSKLDLYRSQLERPVRHKIVTDNRYYQFAPSVLEAIGRAGLDPKMAIPTPMGAMDAYILAMLAEEAEIVKREPWENSKRGK